MKKHEELFEGEALERYTPRRSLAGAIELGFQRVTAAASASGLTSEQIARNKRLAAVPPVSADVAAFIEHLMLDLGIEGDLPYAFVQWPAFVRYSEALLLLPAAKVSGWILHFLPGVLNIRPSS